MSYGPINVFAGTMASGASTITSIDITKAWNRVYAEVSSMSTAVILSVYGSSDNSTFRPVYERIPSTQAVGYQGLTIATNATNSVVPLEVGCRYVQFRGEATIADGANIKLICWD